ncbi:MAG: bis(5'-nucleosyl)-tetraphosphatase (symmetrical) YqeK [Lachnospiraceae bacterium]|nr:bis(5'-nucleosyl)-tetraphosphatase (symmetrical) YqeK [Lachnospiraceae bacterium]
MKDIIKLRKELEKNLDAQRFEHSLGVEYTAACMAFIHGGDVMNARIAGLMHDCAKCLSDDDKIKIMEKAGCPPLQEELDNHSLLHSKCGAIVARDKYGIEDEDILNAIRFHTVGRPMMSLLEKIIYIADFIEPGRKNLIIMEDVRKAAFKDVDQTLLWIMEAVRGYVESKGYPVAPSSLAAYEYYKNQIKPDMALRNLK